MEVSRRYAEAQHQLAQATVRDERAWQALKRTGWWSVLASLVGLLTCCLPLMSLVGLILAVRGWRLARAHYMTAPVGVVLGGILGLLGLVVSAAFWMLAGVSIYQEEQRKAELRQQIAPGAGQVVLTQPTACAMAELELLTTRYRGYSHSNQFRCHGKLEVSADRAVLHDVQASASPPFTAVVCFKRGTLWLVSQVREDADCDASPKPAALHSGAASATRQDAGRSR